MSDMAEKLKEYCTVISGYAFKSKDLSEGTDIPVIKIGNISNGKNVVMDDLTQYVNEEFLSVNEKYHIQKRRYFNLINRKSYESAKFNGWKML